MSYVTDLVKSYDAFVSLPWHRSLAGPQRVWMAVYPPHDERRLRLHLTEFATATQRHGHRWALIDITDAFERWMTEHPYRDAYFEDPELLESALPGFFEHLVDGVRSELQRHQEANGVVGLLGAAALFGLGPSMKVSALLNAVNDAIAGRLLVFFPGDVENNNFRLLEARDGWDYMAVVIKADGSGR